MKNIYRKRGNRYGRKKVEWKNLTFDSKLEASVYEHYWLAEQDGIISDLTCQHTVILQDGTAKERITLKVDFSWINEENGNREYGEAKGFETPEWRLKLKLWRKNPPGRLEIWKGSHKSNFLAEVVE